MPPPPPSPSAPLGTGLRGFLAGLAYPVKGVLFLLRHRAVWPYAALPAVVNGLLMLALAIVAWREFDVLLALVRPDLLEAPPADPAWYVAAAIAAGRAVTAFVAALLAAAGVVLGGLLAGSVLAGPFQEKLSEVVESHALGQPTADDALTLRTLARDARRAVVSALQRLVLFLVVYVPLLALSLIPVVGLLATAATLAYSAFFMALTFSDPLLERRKLALPTKIRAARGQLGPFLGFGAALLCLALVPLLGLLLAPAFVAGGTLLWLDLGPPSQPPPASSPPP